MNSKIISLLILTHSIGLGRSKIWRFIQDFGSAENVVNEGMNKEKNLLFNKWKISAWEETLNACEKERVKLVSYEDPLYPKNLLTITDFPLLLYVKGELSTEDGNSVAIIGTRNATIYGRQAAEKIAREASALGLCVVSGLARGIDTAAHQGALQAGGRTLAVLGSGISHIYPRENTYLAEKIAESGAIISEYPMSMAPNKGLFPKRNRIVSGISQAVCLIESPIEGGGMLTMHLAEKQKRALFALPGRIDMPTFAGNHLLIKEQKARIIEKGSDLSHLFFKNYTEDKSPNPTERGLFSNLTAEEKKFFDTLPPEEKTVDELVLLTQLPIMQLNVLLTRLVLKKVVKELPGKIYKKI